MDCVDRSVEGDFDYNIEHRVLWPDGTVRWVLETGEVTRDENGKAVRMLGIVQEITLRKELEQNIERLRKEYEAFMRHEIKNILVPLKGFSELLLMDGEYFKDKHKRFIENINKNTVVAVNLIDNLKKLQDIEQGIYELETIEFPLGDIIEQTLFNMRIKAAENKVKIDFIDRTSRSNILMDMSLMNGVFINLIKNAIEHVSELDDETQKTVRIVIKEEDENIVVTINNKGKPIPQDKRALFFEKFNSDRTRKQDGTGLGTTYAYLVTKAHGGDITVESNKEDGTTVTVLFKPC